MWRTFCLFSSCLTCRDNFCLSWCHTWQSCIEPSSSGICQEITYLQTLRLGRTQKSVVDLQLAVKSVTEAENCLPPVNVFRGTNLAFIWMKHLSGNLWRYVASHWISVNISVWFCLSPGCIQVQNHLHVSCVTRHSEPRVIKRLTCCLIPKKMVELQKEGFQGGNWWDRNPLFQSYQKLLCRNQLLSQIMVSFYRTSTSAPTVQNISHNLFAVKWATRRCVRLWQHFLCSLFLHELSPCVFLFPVFELLSLLNLCLFGLPQSVIQQLDNSQRDHIFLHS